MQSLIFPPVSEPSYLDDERMHVGNLVLRCHVLLHGLAGAPDSQQDERVGQENDSAGDNVAEEEEADDVAHRCGVLAGRVPVDATGCAIRLGPVLPPARQGADGENTGVAPDPCDQHVSVEMRKLVACGREMQIRAIIHNIEYASIWIHTNNVCKMIKVLEQFDIIAVCLCLRQQMSSGVSASGRVWLDEYFFPPSPGCYLTRRLMSVRLTSTEKRYQGHRSSLRVCVENKEPHTFVRSSYPLS